MTEIDQVLAKAEVVGGAFEFLFAERAWSLRILTVLNRLRYRMTRNYYGDQGLFVRAETFRRLGGFRDAALMEDLHGGPSGTLLTGSQIRLSVLPGPFRAVDVLSKSVEFG